MHKSVALPASVVGPSYGGAALEAVAIISSLRQSIPFLGDILCECLFCDTRSPRAPSGAPLLNSLLNSIYVLFCQHEGNHTPGLRYIL